MLLAPSAILPAPWLPLTGVQIRRYKVLEYHIGKRHDDIIYNKVKCKDIYILILILSIYTRDTSMQGGSNMIVGDHPIKFFLPVTIVIIPDVLVTNIITKLK